MPRTRRPAPASKPPTPGPAAASGFESAAGDVAAELRSAIGKVLDGVPGAPRRPLDLSQILSIDMNLAWKLCNLVAAADPFAGLQKLPGESGMRIFLKAAGRAGVEPAALARVVDALKAYEHLTAEHAGSRVALDSLLGHLARTGGARAGLTARRNAFRAVSSLVGVQAEAQVVTYLFFPTSDAGPEPDPARTAVAIIRGYVGLRRLRTDVSWVTGRGRRTDNDGERPAMHIARPIDPEAAKHHGGVPLLAGFNTAGTRAHARVARTLLPDGTAVDRVQGGPVGRQGAMTFFMGETLAPALPKGRDDRNAHLRLVANSHTPCESLVLDMLFHRQLPPLGPLELSLSTELGGLILANADPRDRVSLTLCESIEPRGAGLAGLRLEESPAYLEALESVCTRLGIDPAQLQAHRVRVKHPPVPCSTLVQRRILW
ncbi:MAG: hypothetical protein LW822_01860 [Phycisphaeraceae bacterium]|jgi:hypothetical protein|nr:hypothetical protein [Phycisphaeraceae bacterium]